MTHDLLTHAYHRALPRRRGPQPSMDDLRRLERIATRYQTEGKSSPGVPVTLALAYASTEIERREAELTSLLERR